MAGTCSSSNAAHERSGWSGLVNYLGVCISELGTPGLSSAAPRAGRRLPACLMPTPGLPRSRARSSSRAATASRASVLLVPAGNSNTSFASNGFLNCRGGPCGSAGAAGAGTLGAGAGLVTAGTAGFRCVARCAAAHHTIATVIPTTAATSASGDRRIRVARRACNLGPEEGETGRMSIRTRWVPFTVARSVRLGLDSESTPQNDASPNVGRRRR